VIWPERFHSTNYFNWVSSATTTYGSAGKQERPIAAPLGRRFLSVKLGPFVDNGSITDSSGLFGSQRWLWGAGIQCKIRVLTGVTVLLSYGRDLRSGKGVFYGTTVH
jgi:hypothetical protein